MRVLALSSLLIAAAVPAYALDSLPLPDYSRAYQPAGAAPTLSIVASDGSALAIDRSSRLGQQQLTTQLGARGWQSTALDHRLQLDDLGLKPLRGFAPYAQTGVAIRPADAANGLLREVRYGGGFIYNAGKRTDVSFGYDTTLGALPGADAYRQERMNLNVTCRF